MNFNMPIAVLALLTGVVAPSVSAQDTAAAQQPSSVLGSSSTAMTENPRRAQQPPEAGCTTVNTVISLASPAIARTAGFEYAQVGTRDLSREIERNAEIVYNANQYARLSSRAPGVIVDVHKDLGDRLKKGDQR